MPKQTSSLIELIKRDSTVDIDYDCLTVSEIQHIISETPLTHENRKIATLRYVDRHTVEEIATEMCYDKRTVKDRLKLISLDVRKVAVKLYSKKPKIEG